MEFGNTTSNIIFVKDFLSEDEQKNGLIFSDWIGDEYRKFFSLRHRINIDNCYAITLLDKRPRGGKWPNKKLDIAFENEIIAKIKANKPILIFALGEGAIDFCLPTSPEKCSDLKMHGRTIYSERFGCFVGCLIRDIKSKDYKNCSFRDIDKIFEKALVADLDIDTFDFDRGNYLLKSPEDFKILVDCLITENKPIAFDYETNTTDAFSPDARIHTVAITNSINKSYATFIDFKNKHSKNGIKFIQKHLARLLTSGIPVIAQNLEFEYIWSKVILGCEIKNPAYDTMVGYHILDDTPKITGLEFQTFELFGKHHKNIIDLTNVEDADEQVLIKYNNLDARITLLLYKKRQEYIRANPWAKRPTDFFMQVLPALYDMKFQGVKVDRAELNKQLTHSKIEVGRLETKIAESKTVAEFKNNYGHALNLGSTKDLKFLLYGDLGITPTNVTLTGKNKLIDCEKQLIEAKKIENKELIVQLKKEMKDIRVSHASTDADTLEEFENRTDIPEEAKEFVDDLLAYRKHNKIISTYLGPYNKYIEYSDLIHPTCALHTTRTYRSSYLNPNLQNIPKRAEFAKEIRKVFIPKYDFFLDGDVSGAEVKVIAMLSKDPTLINELKNGIDPHAYWTARAYEKKECDILKSERDAIKQNFVFLFFYGGWYVSAAKALNMPEKHIKKLEQEFWKKYPMIKIWQEQLKKNYYKKGYVENPFGFRRHGPLATREIINTPVQGTSFLLVLLGLYKTYVELLRAKLQSHLVLQIHDEVIIDSKNEELEQTLTIADTCMCAQHFAWQILPMSIDWKIGKSFGELEKI